jgi:DNA end-binding protein Ku
MAQAIWTGTISFGLVSVPVRLYPAVRRKDVRFHELDRLTGQRVHHQRVRAPLPGEPPAYPAPEWAPEAADEQVVWPLVAEPDRTAGSTWRLPEPQAPSGSTVLPDELVKGFEVAPNRYVAVDRQELEALEPERSRSIDIEQFVDIDAVDPIYFESTYYVVPTRDHARSFGLLVDAMQRTNRMALSWIVLRRKRHLAALRPQGSLLLLSTMLFADEILPRGELEPRVPSDLTAREKEMASLLVNTLSGPFEPDRYRDEYRERVLALIEGRAASARPAEPGPTSPAVADLMAALRASVEQARKARGKPARPAKSAAKRKRKSA